MNVQIHEFPTRNRVGGRQFVAHKLRITGNDAKFSVWFSDHNGGELVDAERIDKLGRATGVRRSSSTWGVLARRVPSLIAAHDGKAGEDARESEGEY